MTCGLNLTMRLGRTCLIEMKEMILNVMFGFDKFSFVDKLVDPEVTHYERQMTLAKGQSLS